MKKGRVIIVVVIAVIVLIGLYLFITNPALLKEIPMPNNMVIKENMLRVTNPQVNDLVRSPIHIEGEARGSWYFEASFPIKLIDVNGKQLGVAIAQTQGNWMTAEFMPFRANLVFTTPTVSSGILIFEKDNPSGLPQNADERRIPVRLGL